MEHAFSVTPFKVEMICDVDGCDGKMEGTGAVPTCNPPPYIHICSKCHRVTNHLKVYPHIDYR
jgi:hypothetical protein